MNLPFLQSPPGAEPVIVEGRFAVPATRVFKAWSDPDEMRLWFGSRATPPLSVQIDFRVGGSWRFTFAGGHDYTDTLCGEYTAIESDRLLIFSWQHHRTRSDGSVVSSNPSRVTVTFEADQDGSVVRLVHESIAQESGRLGVTEGWSASFTKLNAHLSMSVQAGAEN